MKLFGTEIPLVSQESDPTRARIAALEDRLRDRVGVAINRAVSHTSEDFDNGYNPDDYRNDDDRDTLNTSEVQLPRIRDAYDSLLLKVQAAAGGSTALGVLAFIYGVSKYGESRQLSEVIASGSVIGGALGVIASLVVGVMKEGDLKQQLTALEAKYPT